MPTYPDYLRQIQDLVAQHRELQDEPLLLAIYYEPQRQVGDVFLFEVLGSFGGGALETEGDILEVLYGATEHFGLDLVGRITVLHILLSSPQEFRDAATRSSAKMLELRKAFSNGKAQIVYDSGNCNEIIEVIHGWPTPVHG